MARSMILLKSLKVEVDENGEGSWIKLEYFIKFLKENHHPADSIAGIKSNNVRKEINGHRHGLKEISGSDYVSFNSVLKYIFHHCNQINICKRICYQLVQCVLGNTESISNVLEACKAVAKTQLRSKHIETIFHQADKKTYEDDIPSLFKDYRVNFTGEEWEQIVQFVFHFCQRYGSVLDKTPFEEQINLKWIFLKELQDTVLLSSLMRTQTKFTVDSVLTGNKHLST